MRALMTVCCWLSTSTAVLAAAPTLASAMLTGDVRDARSGMPVDGAAITLTMQPRDREFSTQSDARGHFALPDAPPGRGRLVIRARGYRTISLALAVSERGSTRTAIALVPDGPLPRTIGRSLSGQRDAAQAEPRQPVSDRTLAAAGALRTADALGKLPGIDLSGDPLAPGGDAYVSSRGLRPGEFQTLLDGHPIGPIGVLPTTPDADGVPEGFNYQDAPYFALRDVEVTLEPDAARFGADAIGGSVDLRTLEPTARPSLSLDVGAGTQARTSTVVRASGTVAKLGYVAVHGVNGTDGAFSGAPIAQTGLRGTDWRSATLGSLTYAVSGDYVVRNDLAKLVYAPSPRLRTTFTAYSATSWADKTGEGDNDFNPEPYVLANAPVGASPTCPHGVLVTTDRGAPCVPADAYAAAAAGPAGGGPGAWQALRNQDADARAIASVGKSTLGFDAFTDTYALVYHREASPAGGPLDAFLDRWTTHGVRVSDDVASGPHVLGIDVAWLQQNLFTDATDADGTGATARSVGTRTDASFLVRDTYTPSSRFALGFDLALRRTTADAAWRIDPATSLTYRPSRADELRVAVRGTTDEPGLMSDRVNSVPVGALNPDCGGLAQASAQAPVPVSVGSGPATGLSPERGSDWEFGYDHRFGPQTAIGITLYDSQIVGRLVTGQFAAGNALGAAQTAAFLTRIEQFCGRRVVPGTVTLTLGRPFNAATSRLRGIELAGRTRLTSALAVDYAFDVQSSVMNDLPANVLATDPTLVNGMQVFEVPLHKATLGLTWRNRHGFAVDLTGHEVGQNNPQQLPTYAYADASLHVPLSSHLSLRLESGNVFGSHAQRYGLVGYGIPYPTNPLNATLASPFAQPFNERYGLGPTSVTVSAALAL